MQVLRKVSAVGWKPLPRDQGRLSALEASYSYLRQRPRPHELAKLIEGWRPLRPTTVNESGTTFMLQP